MDESFKAQYKWSDLWCQEMAGAVNRALGAIFLTNRSKKMGYDGRAVSTAKAANINHTDLLQDFKR